MSTLTAPLPTDPKELRPLLHTQVDRIPDGYLSLAGRLLLQAEIGPAPEEQRTKLHAAMLSVSFLWRESGGLHMALAGSEGSAVLMADLAGDELTSQTLATVAGNMAERVLVWRGIFANSADSAQAGGDLDAHMDEALIRV